jgi:hypothetical protein
MEKMTDEKLLELLDMYIDMCEQRDEVIGKMGEMLHRQAIELAHYRNMYRLEHPDE